MIGKLRKLLLIDNHTCPWWLAYAWDNRIRKTFHDAADILKPHLTPGDTALDVGCGMGYFSIHMARFVGEAGKVISVDIQPEMLDILRRRAASSHLDAIIAPVLSHGDLSGIGERVDFALNFWMLHEVDAKKRFVEQIFDLLKPGGKYLIAEPKIHTGCYYFESVIDMCEAAGFRVVSYPRISFSRSVVLSRG